MTRLRARLARFVTLRVAFTLMAISSVLAGVAALTALQAQRDVERVVHDNEVAAVVATADRCVTSWSTREDIRDAAEEAARTGAAVAPQALAQLVAELGRPDQAPALDRLDEITAALTEGGVAAARGEIPDPACDLGDAERVLADRSYAEAQTGS